jgi:uncharacterized protein YdeI (YjbR/CyaY-like superfamily)
MATTPKTGKEMPVISFASLDEWRKWIAENHAKSNGVWLRFFKKDSGEKTVTYSEALEEALCYGWIDGQVNKFDDQSYIQRFTPRRPKSIWSKRNTEKAEHLIREGRMKKAGMEQVELAKADGRWQQAYDSSTNMKLPEDFLQELSKNKKAKKPETREKRLNEILAMMREGKKFH